jgi:hypothetical protein
VPNAGEEIQRIPSEDTVGIAVIHSSIA